MSPHADAAKVRLLVLDADGTLTDGGICVDGHGVETKRFSVRDGFAIRAWMRTGRQLASRGNLHHDMEWKKDCTSSTHQNIEEVHEGSCTAGPLLQ